MQKSAQQQLAFVESEMIDFINEHTSNEQLKKAMLYSIQAGGKRLRPLLLLTTMTAFNETIDKGALQAAAALEMVHTYSLIHDDLPAMDDDDLRRGQPTNHKVFGEAYAILAGDGLLTAAFQLLSISQIPLAEKVLLWQQLSKAAGTQGMVAGQVGDIQGETQSLSLAELAAVHEKKTGALIEFALVAGGVLAQQPEELVALLAQFAQHYGLAFQIRDDLLDVTSSEQVLGKKVGRDDELNKSTYPSLLGVAGAKSALAQQLEAGKQTLALLQKMQPDFHAQQLLKLLEQMQLA